MATQYDDIAEQYKRSKLVPWRFYIEQFSLLELMGDLRGKDVLDLACGEGYYTRLLKRNGAARAVGVDLSPKMIELAEQREHSEVQGIEYRVGDARTVEVPGKFDLVVAAYLLNYASTPEDLAAMCGTIARHLKPGGRFCAVNNNPMQDTARFAETRKYGFIKSGDHSRSGSPVRYHFFSSGDLDGPEVFQLENYYLPPELHAETFHGTGFRDAAWHPMRLSPAEAHGANPAHWDDFFVDMPVILFSATKGS
ncbi:MAG: class I SAM-dependent methyltransferase [Bryobacteraceae bacterium]